MKRWQKGFLALLLGLFAALATLFATQFPEETSAPVPTPTPVPVPTATPAPVIPFDLDAIPAFTGTPWVEINGGVPYFAESELTGESFETYSQLDGLSRCGVAYACVGQELMPTEERGEIGMVKPSGWHTVRYDDLIEGKYLYNRCHLIGFQLTGENANEQNLITGTRYLNTQGMLPWENRVAAYVKNTNNHVLYRVTPVFEGEELVARGVLLEALSVEDGGEDVRFCVYAYNVQPGIEIDYLTGSSRREGEEPEPTPEPGEVTYIANKNSMRFHRPDCSGVADMKPSNRLELTVTRDEAIALGYTPCGTCKP